jgi:hypothetical protein
LKEYIKPIAMATEKIKGGLGYRKPLPREDVTVSNLMSEQSSRMSSQVKPENRLKEDVTVSNLKSSIPPPEPEHHLKEDVIVSNLTSNIPPAETVNQLEYKVIELTRIPEDEEKKETQQKLTFLAVIFAWLENLFTGLAAICARLKNLFGGK